MGAHVAAGVVGHVDGVSAASLQGESRRWVRWSEGKRSGSKMTLTDLSVHTGNRAARHAVGDASPHVDFVAQQVFEAPVTELEELVRVRCPS